MDIFSSPLADRHNIGFLQEIADRVACLDKRDIQFLDIKEVNDLAAEYRQRMRALIINYRAARVKAPSPTIRQLYGSHESIFIRRQISDLWKVYRILIADSHEMTALYLAQLDSRKNRFYRFTEKDMRIAA